MKFHRFEGSLCAENAFHTYFERGFRQTGIVSVVRLRDGEVEVDLENRPKDVHVDAAIFRVKVGLACKQTRKLGEWGKGGVKDGVAFRIRHDPTTHPVQGAMC